MKTLNARTVCAAALAAIFAAQAPANAQQGPMIGINVLLNQSPSDAILADLATHGQVLDVIPEINAITLRAHDSELASIQALPYVAAANHDRERWLAQQGQGQPDEGLTLELPDFSGGTSLWNLDAINVTDSGVGRTVGYDGQGVYIAVLDYGLSFHWRDYFLEERIDTVHARAFGGGGGNEGTVSEKPGGWEHNPAGSGNRIISSILGFKYVGSVQLPTYLDGVAPGATVIPVKVFENSGIAHSSVVTRGLLYVTELKTSGALGAAPLVVNMSFNLNPVDAVEMAAINYAIANGVVIVASAEDLGDAGMTLPSAYAPVISVGNAGWVGQVPADDPTLIEWILRDVPEGDPLQYFILADSGRQLPGQDLDVVAPGTFVVIASKHIANGQVAYGYMASTRAACPHVSGLVALMLQKNPGLTPAQIEQILESTAMPVAPGCADISFLGVGPGDEPDFEEHSNVFRFDTTMCWEANATGAGLVQADAALAATPLP